MSRKTLSLAVALLLPVVFAAPAGAVAIGPHIYYVSPEDVDGTIGFGAHADLYQFTPDIHLEANVDYWSKSEGEGDFEVSFKDISFGGTVKYYFGMPEASLRPYALGGLALHMFKFETPEIDLGAFGTIGGGSDTESKIGLDLGGGVQFGSSPKTKFFGELRYRLVSDVAQLCVGAGVTFFFGD